MAFNPFHSFRRYSKVVFAVLAIICMLTFVLSSGMGRGDMFQQIAEMFGGGGGSTVVTVSGTKFDDREFRAVQTQRRIASEYMGAAVAQSHAGLEQRIIEISNRLDPTDRQSLQRAFTQRYYMLQMTGRFDQIPDLKRGLFFQIQQAEGQKKTDLANALGALAKLVDMDLTVMVLRAGQRFFGPNESFDDTVNFLVWRHEADKLGVRLSNDDISQIIADETRGEFTKEAAGRVDQELRQRGRGAFSPEGLFAALGDELRVQIAQVALTGTKNGAGRPPLTAVPTALTPQESWQMFKDARTTVKVGLIDVPVKDFVAQVTATPGEDELKKLFEKYKGDEPAPDRADPGFKDPRKIQVAWVGASPDLPYYQTSVDRLLDIAPALRMLGNTMPMSAVMIPIQRDAELIAQEESFRGRWWGTVNPFGQIYEYEYRRPEFVAGLVGATFASAVPGGAPAFTGPLALQGQVQARATARAVVGTAMAGLAASTDPFGALAPSLQATPPVSLDKIRPELVATARKDLLAGSSRAPEPSGLVASDLYNFRGEVMKLGREKGKAEVEKYVTEFVKQRAAQYGQSEPRDQYHLGDDPGLSPLKQVYQKARGTQDLLLRGFGPSFFQDQTQTGAPEGLFIPHKFITGPGDDKQFYWWRMEDVAPKTPKYEKAKAEVVEAWKRLQARDLAKKEADRLLDLVKRAQGDQAKLRDVAAQNGGREYFDLGPIALYMPRATNPTPGAPREYYTVQPNWSPQDVAQVYAIKADRIAYPDPDMVKRLVDLREKEKGTSEVVTDKPKQHYYVGSLLERQEPTQDEFRTAYRGSMKSAVEGDTLLGHLARGKADEYRKAVLEQLKTEAKVVTNDAARRGNDRTEQ